MRLLLHERSSEQALRVDRPPPTLSYATLGFSPATQGQRQTRSNATARSPQACGISPPPLSAYPRQLASESFQLQPFLPPGVQLVKPDSRLVLFPLGSSPEFAAHQNGAPQTRP